MKHPQSNRSAKHRVRSALLQIPSLCALLALTITAAQAAQQTKPQPAQLLPASIKSAGNITVATDAEYPPNNFVASDGETIIGISPALAHAIGKVLGIKVKMVNTRFASIIPGLKAGRYDMAMSGINDTLKREKKVDFVDYIKVGQQLIVQGGNPDHINSLKDLCGKTVALAKGTVSVGISRHQSAKCKQSGEQPVNILLFPTAAQALLQVRSGRAVANIADSTKVGYVSAHSHGKLQPAGSMFSSAYQGIAVPKGHPKFLKALQAALNAMIANGEYKAILTKWHVAQSGVDKARINGTAQLN